MDNPYDVFGIAEDAPAALIERTYKSLVKKHHPDNGGDPNMFNKIQQAAEILRDPERRKQYDENGFSPKDRPDAIYANAIERVAKFFIESLDTMVNQNQNMDQFDLVKGGHIFFQNEIRNCQVNILNMKRRVKQYEKAIKRLRTKRKSDVIKNMLTSHIASMHQGVATVEGQIKISEKAIEVLSDYEFSADELTRLLSPYGGHI
jgi:DnaJ-class molecular chaperone